jgi:FkbH-like protein
MYRAAAERERVRTEAVDLGMYLRGLDMQLEVRRADAISIPRIAQLTQKTNQFNLTTRRYAEPEIGAMAADDACEVLFARLCDRFGDYGIIGVCILRFEAERASVDSFLLSCRALGRGVEQAFLGEAMRRAHGRGATELIGEYQPTAKNAQTSGFFRQLGFRAIASDDNLVAVRYRFDLRVPLPLRPPQFGRIVTDL